MALFARHGFAGVSLRDIAEEAAVAHNLIRHYFDSKEGIWRAVADAADARFEQHMKPVLTEAATLRHENAEAALALVVRGLVATSARHPEIVRLLVNESAAGGERLDHILARMRPLREAVAPYAGDLGGSPMLRQLDEDELFLFLVLAVTTPFALSPLTNAVLGTDVLGDDYPERYADRLVRTLFNADVR